jgi:hypothetical protein
MSGSGRWSLELGLVLEGLGLGVCSSFARAKNKNETQRVSSCSGKLALED